MNLFFYANAHSQLAENFVNKLLKKKFFSPLIILPAGSHLKCDHSLKLRNGDIMILFAASKRALQELLAMHKKFDEFRVVLILPDQNTESSAAIHVLKPRFISFFDSDLKNLEQVIYKMQEHTLSQRISTSTDAI